MGERAIEEPLPLDPSASRPQAPTVALGRAVHGGVTPSIFALVERGVLKRPAIALTLRGTAALRFRDGFDPVSIDFSRDRILVSDGEADRPDLIVSAKLADVVLLTTAPLRMGLPSPADPRGRAILRKLASGSVRIGGDWKLARGMLELMRIEVAS